MSKATKRKYVMKEVLSDFVLPEDNQFIAQVLAGRGNNLHEVRCPNTLYEEHIDADKGRGILGISFSAEPSPYDIFLVSMPTKFRRNVWIKRGDFLLCDPIVEGEKVRGEIVAVLYQPQIKYIKESGLWPNVFDRFPLSPFTTIASSSSPADKNHYNFSIAKKESSSSSYISPVKNGACCNGNTVASDCGVHASPFKVT